MSQQDIPNRALGVNTVIVDLAIYCKIIRRALKPGRGKGLSLVQVYDYS